MQINQPNDRSWLTTAALVFSVTVAPLQLGCANDSPPPRTVQARTYDGQTVFEGIFFGVGPVHALVAEGLSTDAMPETERDKMQAHLEEAGVSMEEWEASRQAAKVSEDAQNDRARLVAWIDGQDPTFFERFGSDMQSGDHFAVDAALDEAIDLLMQASQSLEASGEIDGFTIGAADPNAACGLGPVCVVAAVAAGWAAVAATVIIVAAVAFWSGGGDGEGDSLARDRVVDYLALNLKPSNV